MIRPVLHLIKEELTSYIESISNSTGVEAVVENIAIDKEAQNSQHGTLNEKIVISLINIEEDRSYRNRSATVADSTTTVSRNPPVYLNLFVLFTINNSVYGDGLDYLTYIIEFFQGKNVFNNLNSIPLSTTIGPSVGAEFSFTMDLHGLNLEQLNNLWTSLGGQQRPCVMYKLRMLKVERTKLFQQRPVITSATLKQKNS